MSEEICDEEREGLEEINKIIDWMDANGKREPRLDSKDKQERMLAQSLNEFRMAKAYG